MSAKELHGPPGRRVRKPRCPICGKPVAPEHRPFCSDRCRRIDLDRWLGETYRVPTQERPDGSGRSSEDED